MHPREMLSPEQVRACREGRWIGPDPLRRAPGEPLWPGRHSARDLEGVRAVVGDYEFSAVFQQSPQRLEGALIKAYDIIQVGPDSVPHGVRWARYWDLGFSSQGDYISGGRVARTDDGKLYIWHIARLRGPWAEAKAHIIEVMLSDPASVPQGIEVSGQQLGYFQEFQRDPRLQGRTIVAVNPKEVGSKDVRAQVWASRVQDSLVHLVTGNGWNVDDFLAEAIAFPRGANDDQVDCISGAVQMLGSGAGWSEWVRRQLEKLRGGGEGLSEVERSFVAQVRGLAEGYGPVESVPGGIAPGRALELMERVAREYDERRQSQRAEIVRAHSVRIIGE